MTEILLEDILILSRTIYGEARGEDDAGKRAVAHTIINRWLLGRGQFLRDNTLATACLRYKQFSSWNFVDPNFERLRSTDLDNPMFRVCMVAALQSLNEPDFTNGALHYHTTWVKPEWAKGHKPCFTSGNHLFYSDVK